MFHRFNYVNGALHTGLLLTRLPFCLFSDVYVLSYWSTLLALSAYSPPSMSSSAIYIRSYWITRLPLSCSLATYMRRSTHNSFKKLTSHHSHFFFPIISIITRKHQVGDRIYITGGKYAGKSAMVIHTTPKMLEITLTCSGQTTRIMSYNATFIDMTSDSSVLLQQPSHNDDKLQILIIQQFIKVKKSITELTTLMKKIKLEK